MLSKLFYNKIVLMLVNILIIFGAELTKARSCQIAIDGPINPQENRSHSLERDNQNQSQIHNNKNFNIKELTQKVKKKNKKQIDPNVDINGRISFIKQKIHNQFSKIKILIEQNNQINVTKRQFIFKNDHLNHDYFINISTPINYHKADHRLINYDEIYQYIYENLKYINSKDIFFQNLEEILSNCKKYTIKYKKALNHEILIFQLFYILHPELIILHSKEDNEKNNLNKMISLTKMQSEYFWYSLMPMERTEQQFLNKFQSLCSKKNTDCSTKRSDLIMFLDVNLNMIENLNTKIYEILVNSFDEQMQVYSISDNIFQSIAKILLVLSASSQITNKIIDIDLFMKKSYEEILKNYENIAHIKNNIQQDIQNNQNINSYKCVLTNLEKICASGIKFQNLNKEILLLSDHNHLVNNISKLEKYTKLSKISGLYDLPIIYYPGSATQENNYEEINKICDHNQNIMNSKLRKRKRKNSFDENNNQNVNIFQQTPIKKAGKKKIKKEFNGHKDVITINTNDSNDVTDNQKISDIDLNNIQLNSYEIIGEEKIDTKNINQSKLVQYKYINNNTDNKDLSINDSIIGTNKKIYIVDPINSSKKTFKAFNKNRNEEQISNSLNNSQFNNFNNLSTNSLSSHHLNTFKHQTIIHNNSQFDNDYNKPINQNVNAFNDEQDNNLDLLDLDAIKDKEIIKAVKDLHNIESVFNLQSNLFNNIKAVYQTNLQIVLSLVSKKLGLDFKQNHN